METGFPQSKCPREQETAVQDRNHLLSPNLRRDILPFLLLSILRNKSLSPANIQGGYYTKCKHQDSGIYWGPPKTAHHA